MARITIRIILGFETSFVCPTQLSRSVYKIMLYDSEISFKFCSRTRLFAPKILLIATPTIPFSSHLALSLLFRPLFSRRRRLQVNWP